VHDAPGELRVSTLALFFDLVFVFTITQLTTVLVAHPDGGGLRRRRDPSRPVHARPRAAPPARSCASRR
jgi:hypothetical protein